MKKEIIINNSLQEAGQISQFLESLGTSLNLPSKITMSVALAIEEMVTEIIQHTSSENKTEEVCLQATIEPEVLTFRITNGGTAFDPTHEIISSSSTPSEIQIIQDLGYFLIYRIMDEVSYNFENGINRLTLIKRINTNFRPEASLATNICKVDGVVILDIEGRLDTANARDFNTAITPLLEEQHPNIIINCAQMSYISSSGLRCFLMLQKSARKNNGSLVIEAMQPEIRHIFEMTGCSSIFNIR